MPKYIYKARTGPKEIIEGSITADSVNTVITKLGEQGYYPISIVEESKSTINVIIKKARVSQKDVTIFTRQIADLLEGGLTLYQALDTLVKQTENKSFAKLIQDIRDRVKEGSPLSDTIQSYPKIFSALYVSMIRAGEAGGMLDSVLRRLADFSEKQQELRSRIRGALTYPFFLAGFGILSIGVLVVFVVPKLTSVFSDFGQELPLPTKILIGISYFIGRWWWIIVVFFTLLIFVIFQQKRTAEGKMVIDRWQLRIPIVGKLISVGEFAKLSRTLSALFESGVPVLKALDIATNTVANEVIKNELKTINGKISKGVSLGAGMEESSYFPIFMVNMIKVGEKGGSIEKSLLKIAESYDREIDRVTRMFTTLLEPMLIITLGLAVGFIVVSMLLPIFNINLAVR